MPEIAWTEYADRECRTLAQLALDEDVADGMDCTTAAIVDRGLPGKAAFVSRDVGVVCGIKPAQVVCELYSRHLSFEAEILDGETVSDGSPIAIISGPAADILTVERTCLNFMGRLSGVATHTSRFVAQVAGSDVKILDTRKTTPAWRHLEKYAVACGGGTNHRMGLFDAILIKDNHLAFASDQRGKDNSIGWAVERARQWVKDNLSRLPNGDDTIIQVEVDNLEQLQVLLKIGVDMVLLDNMTNEELQQAVALRDQLAPEILLEASGGVTLQSVGKIAETEVDRISAGALTHSSVNFDIGLDWLDQAHEPA